MKVYHIREIHSTIIILIIEARTPNTITVNIGATPDLQQSTGLTGPTYFTDVPITGFNYTNTTGVTTITAVGHGLTTGENVKLSGIAFDMYFWYEDISRWWNRILLRSN